MSDPPACAYDEYYYAHDCGLPYQRDDHWLGFFGGIAEAIVGTIAPRSALDAGCAMGFLVEALRDRGVDAEGLDVSAYAIERVRADVRPYCRVASITESLPRRYGLIVCIEVLEHLPPRDAEAAVANLCAHSDDVLFSSTPSDFREPSHTNVQPPEYWAELFARQGLYRDVDYDASFITAWATRFRRRSDPLSRIVRDYERRLWLVTQENAEMRAAAVDLKARLAERQREPDPGQTSAEADASSLTSRLEAQSATVPSPRIGDRLLNGAMRTMRRGLRRGASEPARRSVDADG